MSLDPPHSPTIAIVTPEGVPLALALAGRWERAMAFSLDLGLIAAAGILLALLSLLGGTFLFLAGFFFLRNGYFILWELIGQGTTPGKRAMGLRVIARDGGVLTPERIFARNMVREVELFLPLAALIAPEQLVGVPAPWLWIPALSWIALVGLFPLFNHESARLGDLLAGTLVIELPKVELQRDQAERRSGAEILFTEAQLAIYGEEELETLATILRTASRQKVDKRDLQLVAGTIARKIRFEDTAPRDTPREFLQAFYKAQRASLEQRLLFGKRKASKRE